MLIKREENLNNFDFWAGAKQTKDALFSNEIEFIEEQLKELFPNGIDEINLNDFFWFDRDIIAEWLGYTDFEELENDYDNRLFKFNEALIF